MPYLPLGSVQQAATADNTLQNAGNWTNPFTSDVININVPYFECHHIYVANVPAGASATIRIGTRNYSFTQPFGGSEWDPAQPMLLNPGQDVFFFWTATATGTPPTVTMWFRYDSSIPVNAAAVGAH